MSGQRNLKEQHAKDALMDLDCETDMSRISEEELCVGRWSHYRVPERIEERLSLTKKPRKLPQGVLREGEEGRCSTERDRHYYNNYCQSERAIPKLKCILNQLEAPLHLPPGYKPPKPTDCAQKMKNHIGLHALVISNKQEIRPSVKSERKIFSSIETPKGGENKRPGSNYSNSIKVSPSSAYQKIKRSTPKHSKEELISEKEILSQLIKGSGGKVTTEASPLRNMLNYFTITASDSRKKGNIIGLDRLIS